MKKVLVFLLVLIPLISLSGAIGTSTLNLVGSVESKSLFELDGLFIGGDTLRLDDGDILYDSVGPGAEVGVWTVSANSSASLALQLEFNPTYLDGNGNGLFIANVDGSDVAIPYVVSNGESVVPNGSNFAVLKKVNGMYSEDDNNGSVYIKRVDSNTYPPFDNYTTEIQLTLITN
jgi:hypothetical protein